MSKYDYTEAHTDPCKVCGKPTLNVLQLCQAHIYNTCKDCGHKYRMTRLSHAEVCSSCSGKRKARARAVEGML